jgi:hypothetical protein
MRLSFPCFVKRPLPIAVSAMIGAACVGCAPFTWSSALINGNPCGASLETSCGTLTIDKMTDASGPVYAIRAKNVNVRSNTDYIKVVAYRNGTAFDMRLHSAKDSLQDLGFTTFTGGPGSVFIGLGLYAADSFQIDISECFSRRGSSCYNNVITIVPCKKHSCGKCTERK